MEPVKVGWDVIVGYDPERIKQVAMEIRPGIESAWPYGDGHAAEQIIEVLTGVCKEVDQ